MAYRIATTIAERSRQKSGNTSRSIGKSHMTTRKRKAAHHTKTQAAERSVQNHSKPKGTHLIDVIHAPLRVHLDCLKILLFKLRFARKESEAVEHTSHKSNISSKPPIDMSLHLKSPALPAQNAGLLHIHYMQTQPSTIIKYVSQIFGTGQKIRTVHQSVCS